jgi:lipoyl(octanoyl) transferase
MEFELYDFGLVDFKRVWDFQKEVFLKVREGSKDPTLIFCRHDPVITLGRSAKKDELKTSEAELKNRAIQLYSVDRGGGITYHGPGQQMLYFILDLKYFRNDIRLFLRFLEDMVINVLAQSGILGQRISGFTGVWVDDEKISSVGITVRNWIAYHGLAINVKADDLSGFSLIQPCGMDIQMTSMETVLGRKVTFAEVKKNLIRRWENDQGNLAGIGTRN